MKLVKMTHPEIEGVATAPEKSFKEYWSLRGWELLDEEPTPEGSPDDEGEPANDIYNSQED